MSVNETIAMPSPDAADRAPSDSQQAAAQHECALLPQQPLQFRISVRKVQHDVQVRGVLAE
jgi:hypothetical protein